jgi:hypothetical protein
MSIDLYILNHEKKNVKLILVFNMKLIYQSSST